MELFPDTACLLSRVLHYSSCNVWPSVLIVYTTTIDDASAAKKNWLWSQLKIRCGKKKRISKPIQSKYSVKVAWQHQLIGQWWWSREEGRRFQLFWWISHPKYCLNILVIEPHSDRDLMVLWARAPGFKARHFVVLWFNPQPGQFFFHKIYFPLFIIFFFYLWKILLLCFLKNFQF